MRSPHHRIGTSRSQPRLRHHLPTPPDLSRPRAASANLSRPGPSYDHRRGSSAPARGGNERTEASIALHTPALNPGLLELPPDYMRPDPHDQVYRLHPPFISSTPTAESPMTTRFQLSQQRTGKNKPHELRLRRLSIKERRRVAMSGWEPASIKFKKDLTMYSIANTYASFPWSLPEIDIRRCKAHTLKRFVRLKRTPTTHQFWHITKNVVNDTLRPENRRNLENVGGTSTAKSHAT